MPYEHLRGEISVVRATSWRAIPDLVHFASTRRGGSSTGRFERLNLSYGVGDEVDRVTCNREDLFRRVGVPLGATVFGEQVHGGEVFVAVRTDRGRGSDNANAPVRGVDALVTNEPGVCLCVLSADCCPVLAYDGERRVVGVAHAGRKGLTRGVVTGMVERMRREFGSDPAELKVVLGPHIDGPHYPISASAAKEVEECLGSRASRVLAHGDNTTLDLSWWVRLQLGDLGVRVEQVEDVGLSTFVNRGEFFSERRDGPPVGRMLAGIMLRGS